MAADAAIDPRLLEDPSSGQPHSQPRIEPVTLLVPPRNLDDPETPSDGEGNPGSEKRRRKLNLWKCKPCRDARKKCFPNERVWPQKCDRCRQHRPEELECSEPQLNTRKRGPNLSKPAPRLKPQPTGEKAESQARESYDDSSSDDPFLYERPARTAVTRITREYPASLEPVSTAHQLHPVNMEVPHPASVYLPLGEGEFRILRLAPGRKEDIIVCSFYTASINQPGDYEAISYLWGGSGMIQQLSAAIQLRDSEGKLHTVSIRRNLYAALHSLRHPKDVSSFWVDTLCMCHSNGDEMNRQTAMKLDILRNAANLCVWLGQDANSRIALAFIPRILDLFGVDRLVRDDSAIDGWIAVVALLRHPIFSRLWLVQEVSVARNVTLHCGLSTIHYRDLVDAVAMLVSFQADLTLLFRRNQKNYRELADRKMTMAKRFIDVSANALRITSSGKIQRLLSLEALVSQLRDLNSTDPRDRIFSVLAVAKDGFKLVEETPKENIHGQRHEGVLRIDYSKSILEVYQDVVIHVIERSRSLDIICRHWASSVSESEARLPTWIRPLQSSLPPPFDSDISERIEADSLVGLPDHNYYNASRGTVAKFRIGSCQSFDEGLFLDHGESFGNGIFLDHGEAFDNRIFLDNGEAFDNGLFLDNGESFGNGISLDDGKSLDNIESFGNGISLDDGKSLDNRKSLLACGFRVDVISKLGPRASEGIILYEWLELGGCHTVSETVPEDFWRTLVADRDPNGNNAPLWYPKAFLYCLHHLTPTGDINTNRLIAKCEAESSLVADFLERVQSVIWNRKFLVSKQNNWVGLAPMAAQVEDVICVLYGCSVPVVLRPQKATDGQTFFQVVGECYVHGIMNGEITERAGASGDIDEEFELR